MADPRREADTMPEKFRQENAFSFPRKGRGAGYFHRGGPAPKSGKCLPQAGDPTASERRYPTDPERGRGFIGESSSGIERQYSPKTRPRGEAPTPPVPSGEGTPPEWWVMAPSRFRLACLSGVQTAMNQPLDTETPPAQARSISGAGTRNGCPVPPQRRKTGCRSARRFPIDSGEARPRRAAGSPVTGRATAGVVASKDKRHHDQ
jgi:hypothetical protein